MSKTQFLAENLKQGEIYAGIILGKDGQPDYHLVLLPGTTTGKWLDAFYWTSALDTLEKSALPTRCEQSLLIANCKEEFEPHLYWSNEQYAAGPDYAWMQDFNNGYQFSFHKSNESRARAVRRILIIE
jgi:hypothetical protein